MSAIHPATQKPAKPARTTKIAEAQYGPHVWREGHCRDADDARTFANIIHAHFYAGGRMSLLRHPNSANPNAMSVDRGKKLNASASDTAPDGGKTQDHREDKDGNPLECSKFAW
jgi:hypothetical protein